MSETYYLVSQTELLKLLQAADDLDALECAGVDNWLGYGEAEFNEITEHDLSTYKKAEGVK